MSFCIECGAKAPDVAKFCPQCGSSLVEIETVSDPTPAPIVVTPEVQAPEVKTPEAVETETVSAETSQNIDDIATEVETENLMAETAPVDIAPSAAASLAAAASVVEDEPKSKAGLFIGLGLVALMAAGGGAYAMGLFGDGDEDSKRADSEPTETTPTALPETETIEIDKPETNPVLTAYKNAIKAGRISDLGEFAKNNSKNSLAKDAEAAAFASLQRQESVLAYNTFTQYFPEADTSTYTGPRVNADEDALSTDSVVGEMDQLITATSSIRVSITQRADELDPFIAQGDTGYALIVIDEMLSLTDLNDAEATYLLNLRARTETSRGLVAPAQPEMSQTETVQPEFIQPNPVQVEITQVETPTPVTVEPIIIKPASVETTPVPDGGAAEETPIVAAIEALNPDRAYDTAAKPIERFGAITPDAATEPGSCDMAFSINTAGSPTNIIASCTDPLFIQPAKETVAEWTYSPAILAGEPVQQNGVVVTIRFNLE